jgi:hypothetical protein
MLQATSNAVAARKAQIANLLVMVGGTIQVQYRPFPAPITSGFDLGFGCSVKDSGCLRRRIREREQFQMAEGWDLATLAKWRGREVLTQDDEKLGAVESIIYDSRTTTPRWIAVGGGIIHPHIIVVPAHSTLPDGDNLKADYTKEALQDEPPIEFGEGWSAGPAARILYDYFGIPFREEDDVRVLHRHDELPGQERVIGGGAGSP